MKKILIVGSTGNIGSIFFEHFQNTPHFEVYSCSPSVLNGYGAFSCVSFANVLFDYILFAIKPQTLYDVLRKIPTIIFDERTVVLSVLAGTLVESFSSVFARNRVVRIMPNLGIKVGCGLIGVFGDLDCNLCIDKLGSVIQLKQEDDMHAFTALAGCGIGFAFKLFEFFRIAGVEIGSENCEKIIIETFKAACELAKSGNFNDLYNQVASKGGVTQASSVVLNGAKDIICQTLKVAVKKSVDLNLKNVME